eukprot:TRINITY_DN5897_c0_g1_i1.p1 TRINITY_DN5897_c0_g1~~TRINITY_DN5897_c0_g1_i1.p1  ORF type:complete len:600 (-),score=132.52 TRINITY_DN5897_c0_g1_i1:515-2314(-)
MAVYIFSSQASQPLVDSLQLLQSLEGFQICAFTSAEIFLERIKTSSASAKLLIIEGSTAGLYLLRQIQSLATGQRENPVFVLVPSESNLDPYLDEFFAAGAVDIVSLSTPKEILQTRIQSVFAKLLAKRNTPAVQQRTRSLSSVLRTPRRSDGSTDLQQISAAILEQTASPQPQRRRTSLNGDPLSVVREHESIISAVESILNQMTQQELSCERVRERLECLAQNIRSEISNLSSKGLVAGDVRDADYRQVYDIPESDGGTPSQFVQAHSRLPAELSPESDIVVSIQEGEEAMPMLLLDEMKDMTFDVWKYSHHDLLLMAMEIFKDLGLIEAFHINPDHLRSFLSAIEASYRPWNPYHNFRHAMDVLMNTYFFLTTTDLRDYLLPIDILALAVAAICHDIDHPGCSNAFEINTHSAKAVRYNDISVLENHHISFSFLLLRHPQFNIFSGLSMEEFKEIRRITIQAILATDMAVHFDALAKFVKKLDAEDGFSKPCSKEDRQVIINVILHFADICNGCKPWEPHKKWQDVLLQEFFLQVSCKGLLMMIICFLLQRGQFNRAFGISCIQPCVIDEEIFQPFIFVYKKCCKIVSPLYLNQGR